MKAVFGPMMTKWSDKNVAGAGAGASPLGVDMGEKSVVLLLYGKNNFGDKIYSYLKITLSALQDLRNAVQTGNGFNPGDYGTVIAAGKGDPTEEVRAEVAASHQVIDNRAPEEHAHNAETPAPKKAWDEY